MMIYKEATLDAGSLVKEEMGSKIYERTEAKRKRVRFSDVDQLENVGIGTKQPRKRSRELLDCYDNDFHVQSYSIMDRANEVQEKLNQEFPSFIKLMLRSHVTRGFYLGLPAKFCKKHMPKVDESIVLVEENGEEHRVKFLASHSVLSGGWRGFALKHELQEGDVVVFQLVSRCKFKVYIVRKNDLSYADGALDLLKLEANPRENNIAIEVDTRTLKEAEMSKKADLHSKTLQDNAQTNDQLENSRKDYVAEGTEYFENAGSFVDFQSFTITVNGFALDSELSESLRTKYYELCFSRKSYLHEHLLKSINPRLAAEMITKTVNIADSIQACDVFTSPDDFAVWDKTLESFELLGMDVDFLRSHLNKWLRLALQSRETPDFKRYNEAKLELNRVEEDIMTFETTLNRLKQAKNRLEEDIMSFETSYSRLNQAKNVLESEIDTLKAKVQRYGRMFEEEAARTP